MSERKSVPENSGEEHASSGQDAERGLRFWFVLVVSTNVVGLFWLSVRADSPQFVRGILDVFLHGATAAALVFLAFRALLRFPYRFPDLLIMVAVLSLGMKRTVDFVHALASMGLVSTDLANGERFGEIFQLCLLTSSVLLAGAALGLRHCTMLKIERPLARAACLVAGMVALPAMAGVAAFPVVLFRELFKENPSSANMYFWMVEWFASIAATIVNVRCFLQTLTLETEVGH